MDKASRGDTVTGWKPDGTSNGVEGRTPLIRQPPGMFLPGEIRKPNVFGGLILALVLSLGLWVGLWFGLASLVTYVWHLWK